MQPPDSQSTLPTVTMEEVDDCDVLARLGQEQRLPEFSAAQPTTTLAESHNSFSPFDQAIPKRPVTFQCSLCPERFTRAYNLASHLRTTHTNERPLVCSICGKAFTSQHNWKRHESIHSGQKRFTCGGILKNGNKWGCGLQYAQVDQLAYHFRSQAGHTCIRPLLEEEFTELHLLLKECALQMASRNKITGQDQRLLDNAINLVRHYRPKIARYFRDNVVSKSVSVASLSERLQGLGEQSSLDKRLSLLTKPGSNNMDLGDMAPHLQIDEEMEGLTGEGGVFVDLESVRNMLVSSEVFHKLILNSRLRLYHDDKAERRAIRSIVLDGELQTKVRFTMNWDILGFMRTQYGEPHHDIGSIVVLTGTTLCAQATTCAEYIRKTWPKSGPSFLESLTMFLRSCTARKSKPGL
jgi:hypothetical protein